MAAAPIPRPQMGPQVRMAVPGNLPRPGRSAVNQPLIAALIRAALAQRMQAQMRRPMPVRPAALSAGLRMPGR